MILHISMESELIQFSNKYCRFSLTMFSHTIVIQNIGDTRKDYTLKHVPALTALTMKEVCQFQFIAMVIYFHIVRNSSSLHLDQFPWSRPPPLFTSCPQLSPSRQVQVKRLQLVSHSPPHWTPAVIPCTVALSK